VGDALEVCPEIAATLEHRKAASGCCGAGLYPGEEPGSFVCRKCGQPCGRVLGEPREVTAHG
jgi:hypothetical protein